MKARVPAKLTNAQKEAMNLEIKKQLVEFNEKNELEMDAMILWILHEYFGFGPKRLREFYDIFGQSMDDLKDRYLMGDSDMAWLCTYKLKEYGIDLEKWDKDAL